MSINNTVKYFPHYVERTKTKFILQQRYGNNGYAFWFKLLEKLASSNNHFIDLRQSDDFEYFVAEMGVSVTETPEILNLLAKLNAIDKALWTQKIIWCQNFIDNIEYVYEKRKREPPTRPKLTKNGKVGIIFSGTEECTSVTEKDNLERKL